MGTLEQCDYYGDDVSTLGERISVAREHAGLSEAELAARLAVQRTTIDAWEGDGAEPRASKLTTLAGLLGVSPVWLLTGAGAGVPAPNEAEAMDGSALRLRLAQELREALSEQARIHRRIERIADALATID